MFWVSSPPESDKKIPSKNDLISQVYEASEAKIVSHSCHPFTSTFSRWWFQQTYFFLKKITPKSNLGEDSLTKILQHLRGGNQFFPGMGWSQATTLRAPLGPPGFGCKFWSFWFLRGWLVGWLENDGLNIAWREWVGWFLEHNVWSTKGFMNFMEIHYDQLSKYECNRFILRLCKFWKVCSNVLGECFLNDG